MTIKERKEREKEEKRSLILKTARAIAKAEGMDKLSIRKIADRIEYSPAIIYHYFKDKDDIVSQMLQETYAEIMEAMASAQVSSDDPAQRIKDMCRNYAGLAFKIPDEYLTVMLGSSPAILQHTSVLSKGASKKRPAVGILCQNLSQLFPEMDERTLELTAQIIWSATFGLIVRLILETDIDEAQRKLLVEYQLQCMVDTMLLGKPLASRPASNKESGENTHETN